MHSFKILNQMG